MQARTSESFSESEARRSVSLNDGIDSIFSDWRVPDTSESAFPGVAVYRAPDAPEKPRPRSPLSLSGSLNRIPTLPRVESSDQVFPGVKLYGEVQVRRDLGSSFLHSLKPPSPLDSPAQGFPAQRARAELAPQGQHGALFGCRGRCVRRDVNSEVAS